MARAAQELFRAQGKACGASLESLSPALYPQKLEEIQPQPPEPQWWDISSRDAWFINGDLLNLSCPC